MSEETPKRNLAETLVLKYILHAYKKEHGLPEDKTMVKEAIKLMNIEKDIKRIAWMLRICGVLFFFFLLLLILIIVIMTNFIL